VEVNSEVHLRKMNRPGEYRQFYDKKTKLLVENIFKEDIERFGYAW